MDTLTVTLWILGIAIALSFGSGLITQNNSTVDRLWSVLPPVYVLVWLRDFCGNPRYVYAALLVVLWGIRLTINFASKGGYSFSWKRGFYGEDYRWAILRAKIPNRFLFELFNLTFISFYQLALVFGFTLPLYFLGQMGGDVTPAFAVLLGVHAALLIAETIADIQQLRFYQQRSSNSSAADARVALGFNTSGMWKHSRHPNYVCEMGQWIVVALYPVVASGALHWSGVFAALLVLLFVGSTIMAERITASKYPAYAEWKKATPPWVPFIDLPLRLSARIAFFKKYGV